MSTLSLDQSSTNETPNASSNSLITKTPRNPTPRSSISQRQAVDSLELALTQSNDLQHLLEQYANKMDEKIGTLKKSIDIHFSILIQQLKQRQESIHQQVDLWKAQKIIDVNKEVTSAIQYEDALLKAHKTCKAIMDDDKLDINKRKKEVTQIKDGIFCGDESFKKYQKTSTLANYINDMTSLLEIDYPSSIAFHELDRYGQVKVNSSNSFLSVPTLKLLTPIRGRESKSGYKIDLKWTTSQPLVPQNFIIRCLAVDDDDKHNNKNDNNDDEKKQHRQLHGQWKSLLFDTQKTNHESTQFEAKDIDTIFLFDQLYLFRVEYHITDPINLLVGSNEELFIYEQKPPSSNKADLIELEYFGHKGNSYEGHPKHLLLDGRSKKYRSAKNKDFGYDENDWIIFKIKHSGDARSYLPKAVILRNDPDVTGVKECIISVAPDGNSKEWHKYDPLNVKRVNDYQQLLLNGVDWKLLKNMKSQFIKLELVKNHGERRNAQCRFKLEEFRIYGLEF